MTFQDGSLAGSTVGENVTGVSLFALRPVIPTKEVRLTDAQVPPYTESHTHANQDSDTPYVQGADSTLG